MLVYNFFLNSIYKSRLKRKWQNFYKGAHYRHVCRDDGVCDDGVGDEGVGVCVVYRLHRLLDNAQ